MATISSPPVANYSCSLKPSTRFTSLSSSSTAFFSCNVSNQAGLSLSTDRSRKVNRKRFSCNALFGLGVPEIAVIVGVTVLVFGPKKLPEVGRSIGKTVKSFQQAAKEFESELKKDGAEPSPAKIEAVGEEEKEEAKVPSNKESS